MTERIAISEAPEAVLGAPGTTQNLPIAELNREGLVVPKRTTIEAMMAFFGGGGGGLAPQIQQFSSTGAASQFFSQIAGVAVSDYSNFIDMEFRRNANSLIAGDENAYSIVNDNVVIRDAGVYKFTWNLWATYRNTGRGGLWRWAIELYVADEIADIQTIGRFIEPITHTATVRIPLGHSVLVGRVAANTSVAVAAALRNVGGGPSPTPRQERIQIAGDTGATRERSQLLIEKLAD